MLVMLTCSAGLPLRGLPERLTVGAEMLQAAGVEHLHHRLGVDARQRAQRRDQRGRVDLQVDHADRLQARPAAASPSSPAVPSRSVPRPRRRSARNRAALALRSSSACVRRPRRASRPQQADQGSAQQRVFEVERPLRLRDAGGIQRLVERVAQEFRCRRRRRAATRAPPQSPPRRSRCGRCAPSRDRCGCWSPYARRTEAESVLTALPTSSASTPPCSAVLPR